MKQSIIRRTKIICTLGPACMDEHILEQMIRAGMDVARFNFSHGDFAFHTRMLKALRKVSAKVGKPIGILQDLGGPKIRLGILPGGSVDISRGQEMNLICKANSKRMGIRVAYTHLSKDVKKGNRILFDDGTLEAHVLSCFHDGIKVRFLQEGRLKSRKGINLPDAKISAPSVTAKDRKDLEWGLAHQIDYVALSFVRRPEDLLPVRRRINKEQHPPLLISKLERPEAIIAMEQIVAASDIIMVARGDLGVEMPFEKVPLIQKRLIRYCNKMDVPVITATQMLESMTDHPRPTRAEVSDVSNAIMDGTDAVMLSGETAAGKNPVGVVQAMSKIATETETFLFNSRPKLLEDARKGPATSLHDALALGVERVSTSLEVKAIAAITVSGETAKYLASSRPRVPVLAISYNRRTVARMTLFWGIIPTYHPKRRREAGILKACEHGIHKHGLARKGEVIVVAIGRDQKTKFTGKIVIHRV